MGACNAITEVHRHPEGGERMAVITIRGVDDHVKQAIRERAARHGRSMEAELRSILADAAEQGDSSLVASVRTFFADSDWDPDLIPPREQAPQREIFLP
jgi:plasmid stability protein